MLITSNRSICHRILNLAASLFILAVLLFGATQVVAQSEHKTAPTIGVETYRLGPGDKVRVLVYGQEDLSGDFEVDGLGQVSLPLIRDVSAGGLTLSEVEVAITKKLKPDFLKNPRVSVSVLNYRPFYIFGEVKRPGSYSFVNGMKVVNAIALGGGFTYRAHHEKALLIRARNGDGQKEVVDHQTIILPGDVIEIPERFF